MNYKRPSRLPIDYRALFSLRARALRLAADARIEDVASAIDISANALRKFELGLGIRCEKVAPLAHFYGVSTDYLLGITDDPTPAPLRADLLSASRAIAREKAPGGALAMPMAD